MPGFCPDSIWDVAWNSSEIPVLSECFQHTVLIAVPAVFFWLLLPILILQCKISEQPALQWSTIMSMKWLVQLCLVVDRMFVLAVAIIEAALQDQDAPVLNIAYPALQAITFVALLVMKNECRRHGIRSSGILFNTYLLLVICGAPEFYTWIKIGSDQESVGRVSFFRYVAYLAYYPLLLLQLFLFCFSDPLTLFRTSEEYANCPEVEASFLNRQMLYWFGDLVSRGHKKPLEVHDLFDLESTMKAENLYSRWLKVWEPKVRAYQQLKSIWDLRRQQEDQDELLLKDKTPLLEARVRASTYGSLSSVGIHTPPKGKRKQNNGEPPLPSIVGSLYSLFKWNLLGATLIKVCSDILQFANPGLLNLLITFISDASAPWWQGVGYAIGLFAASALRSLLLNNYFVIMQKVGVMMQSCLTTAVYEKTMRLSNAARKEKSMGEIVNLMAIDVERFQTITPQVQQYWSSPFQIIMALFLLWQTVGASVLAGVVIMVVLLPVNFLVSVKVKKWQVEQMRLKDQRIKMTNEVLSGIKVVKLYAWEPPMESTINEIRDKEMALLRKAAVIRTAADMCNVASPFLVALTTFTTYTLTSADHVLTPQVAFVSLTLFNQLRPPMMMVADLIAQTVQVVVSNRRLKEFLLADELKTDAIDRQDHAEYYSTIVEAEAATFTWDKEAQIPTLRDITLGVGNGHLMAVIGKVGSGKSSLMQALLGEMEKLRGYVGIRGEVAYAAQQAWIQNLTLRDNIIMGRDFDKKFYEEVLEACALKPDLELLPHGDQTEIGEKGINLSGGQKARVALARAVYQRKDVYLLDDPLSAVDSHVAVHIFEKVLGPNGLLAGTTRLLVTHALSFLPQTDEVAVINEGKITHVDKYDNLIQNPEVAQLLQEVAKKEEEEDEGSTPSSDRNAEEETDKESDDNDDDRLSIPLSKVSLVKRSVSAKSTRSHKSEKRDWNPMQLKKLVEAEKAETGRVAFSVYVDYYRAMGIFRYFVPFVLTMVLSYVFQTYRSLWLSAWSDENVEGADPSKALPLGVRLGVYAVVGSSDIIFMFAALALLILGGVRASLKLHRPLLHNILRSPLSFFDVTPLGRILNRFSKDMEQVDLRLSSNFRFLFISFGNVIQTTVIISMTTPLFIVVFIPVIIIYLLVLRYFITTSRQLQRLSSITRSPIYSHFAESIQGAASIRAFGWTQKFCDESKEKCRYLSLVSNRWLSVRLEFLGNLVILAAALLSVLSKNWGTVTAGSIGLSVTYSFSITFMLNMFVRQISEVESNIVSVERIKDYTQNPTEAAWRTDRKPPTGWPGQGAVHFVNYSTRYRPGLDLVLRNIEARVRPHEKIGIVGRTGAGKSSFALALFRIVEPTEGKILIDNIDISALGLHDLRESITIIPQDPVLFSGTLRFNLDPFDHYSDSDLYTALELCSLKDFVIAQNRGLEHVIEEGGQNISVGQRQLVCLTRALLRRTQLLVLDEATAAVDRNTDALIQKTIREQFTHSTVLTIAHRLNTIIDYDRIMVMDAGRIVEFDPPQQLLTNPNSVFFHMAKAAKLI